MDADSVPPTAEKRFFILRIHFLPPEPKSIREHTHLKEEGFKEKPKEKLKKGPYFNDKLALVLDSPILTATYLMPRKEG